MKTLFISLLALLSASCASKRDDYKTYIVLGREIHCSDMVLTACGYELRHCDGDSFEVHCAVNVVELKGLSQ